MNKRKVSNKMNKSKSFVVSKAKKRFTAQAVRAILNDSDDESVLGLGDDIVTSPDESESDGESADFQPAGACIPSTSFASGDGSTWKKEIRISADRFQQNGNSGARNVPANFGADTDALDFMSLFLTQDVWNQLVEMTNLRAAQVKRSKPNDYYATKWDDVTVEEMKAFVGVRISMEYSVIKRRLEFYFSRKSGSLFDTPGYRKIFTRDRFLAIWKFMHYVDEENPATNKTDKLYKVRPLIDYLCEKFQSHYVPRQQMSLDEGMIPAKNRTTLKQYIQSKPVKWGIKSFLLCESSTGYVYNIEIYTGKTSGLFLPHLGATGSLVIRLASCIAGQNHQLFMDRYYNSPALSRHLLTMNIHTCGTIQTNRKGFPKQLIQQKKVMKRGDHDYLYCDGITVVVWCDRVPLYFITTFHDLSSMSVVNRKNKDGSVVPVSCPKVISEYTKSMGGCDRNDQLTKLYRSRKHYRWPRRLIIKCVLWSFYNAYIINGKFKPHRQSGRRLRTFYDCRRVMRVIDWQLPNQRNSSSALHTSYH